MLLIYSLKSIRLMRGGASIFDKMEKDKDFIIAFFPCVRFEDQIILHFKGKAYGVDKWSIDKKLRHDLKLHRELHELYTMITKLALICLDKKLSCIIENPYSTQHYLYRYWALEPAFIDYDRREMGDYYEKPTQYFFINCDPKFNFIFEGVNRKETKKILKANQVERSMISKDYANRFIREFILDESEWKDYD